MQDRSLNLSLTCLTSHLFAVAAVALVGYNFTRPPGDDAYGILGVLVGFVAAVLRVRRYFTRMLEREQNAFELGRDSVESVRQLR